GQTSRAVRVSRRLHDPREPLEAVRDPAAVADAGERAEPFGEALLGERRVAGPARALAQELERTGVIERAFAVGLQRGEPVRAGGVETALARRELAAREEEARAAAGGIGPCQVRPGRGEVAAVERDLAEVGEPRDTPVRPVQLPLVELDQLQLQLGRA